ncbi:hypothetical protein [Mycoplasma buteonis]|uniref:hypothetical protein n=1 Tax=Mycoplasma buteonis TaxID=171280 RepID=UPI000ACCEE55|nr:hypothetical protein [Mycoplasma buteonis]
MIAPALISLAVPVLSISCNHYSNAKYSKLFIDKIDPKLKSFTDQYLNVNSQELKDFYNTQSQIDKSVITDYRTALIFAPLWDVNILDNSGSKKKQTILGIDILSRVVTKDWFWILNNLDMLQFIFNPYGSDYSENADPQNEIFYSFSKSENALTYTNTSKKITNIFSYDFNFSKFDAYLNKKIHFFELSDHKFLILFTYQEEEGGETKFFMLPELFTYNSNLSFKDFSSSLLEKIIQTNQKIVDDKVAYEKKYEDDVNVDEIAAKFNDVNFLKVFNRNNYAEIFSRIIADFYKANLPEKPAETPDNIVEETAEELSSESNSETQNSSTETPAEELATTNSVSSAEENTTSEETQKTNQTLYKYTWGFANEK